MALIVNFFKMKGENTMANINTNGLAMELSEEAVKAYELLKDKLPNIQDLDKTPERLLNLQGENADIIGALFKNSLGEAEYVCRNGQAIVQCANEINRVSGQVSMALVLGGVALGLGAYILYKMNKQEEQILALARAYESDNKALQIIADHVGLT